jgi:hypothetical protein
MNTQKNKPSSNEKFLIWPWIVLFLLLLSFCGANTSSNYDDYEFQKEYKTEMAYRRLKEADDRAFKKRYGISKQKMREIFSD